MSLVTFYAHKKKCHFKTLFMFNINFKEKEKNGSLSKKIYYLKKKRQRGNIVQIKSVPPNTCAIKSIRHESWKFTNFPSFLFQITRVLFLKYKL